MSAYPSSAWVTLFVAVLACSAPPRATNKQTEMVAPRSVEAPRRLELVVQTRGALVEREERVAVTTTDVTSAEPRPEELSLLWRLGRGFGAVLRRGEIATRGPARKVAMSKDPGDFMLEKDVAESALGSFESLRGRVLDLYGKDGVECTATVTGFRAVGGFTQWGEQEPADSVWDALAERYLVAVVEPEDAGCRPLWARAHDLPKPTLLRARELTADETRRATRALGRTAVARSLQASYSAQRADSREPHGPETWDALEPREWRATAFQHPDSSTTYFSAELSAGEGCGDFGGYALGFFESGASSWLDVTGDGSPDFPDHPLFGLAPAAAVTLEPQGPVFFIHADAIYANTGKGVVPLMTIGRTGTTCGC